MGKSKDKSAAIDIPVQFGGVSLGDATARLGLKIDRSVCNINTADDTFCGHRLSGRVILGGSDDASGQGRLVDDLDHHVDAVFDVKRFGANAKEITTSLTFSLKDVDLPELAKLSKGSGRLIIDQVAELPENSDEEGDESDDAPTPLKVTGPWRDVQLDTLFHGGLLKSLKKGGLITVGNLADFTANGKRVTAIEGIGPEKAAKIEEVMLAFWAANPTAADTVPEKGAEAPAAAESAPQAAENWREQPLSVLGMSTGINDMFGEGKVTTIGGLIELRDAINGSRAVWPKGIGRITSENAMARLDSFLDKHEHQAAT